jgi:hypothetical protein
MAGISVSSSGGWKIFGTGTTYGSFSDAQDAYYQRKPITPAQQRPEQEDQAPQASKNNARHRVLGTAAGGQDKVVPKKRSIGVEQAPETALTVKKYALRSLTRSLAPRLVALNSVDTHRKKALKKEPPRDTKPARIYTLRPLAKRLMAPPPTATVHTRAPRKEPLRPQEIRVVGPRNRSQNANSFSKSDKTDKTDKTITRRGLRSAAKGDDVLLDEIVVLGSR